MSQIDPAQFRLLLDNLHDVRLDVKDAIVDLGVALHNPLWLQVLIGILASLGAELAIGVIDLAVDQARSSSSWVRPIERGELPVLDNFFDR